MIGAGVIFDSCLSGITVRLFWCNTLLIKIELMRQKLIYCNWLWEKYCWQYWYCEKNI